MSTLTAHRVFRPQGVESVRVALILVMALVVAVGGWLLWGRLRPDHPAATSGQRHAAAALDPADATDGRQVVAAALGRLEPAQGVLQIGALPGERLGQVLVRVGDQVEAGAELAHLDSRPLREVERDLAQSQLHDAQLRLSAEKAVAATTVAEAQLGLEQAALQELDITNQQARSGLAAANLDAVGKELARLEGLSNDLVPQQELDQKRLLERQAQQEVLVAQTMLDKLRAGAKLAERSAAAKVAAAKANAELLEAGAGIGSLEQGLRLAQARFDQTVVRAPLAGEILDILTQPGEMISQRPILQMADLGRMQIVAEVYETDIGQVRKGQRALATSRALASPLAGTVIEIGAVVSPNEVQSLSASAPSAQRVVKVRIQLDEDRPAPRLINLQVDVQFLAGNEAAPVANAAR